MTDLQRQSGLLKEAKDEQKEGLLKYFIGVSRKWIKIRHNEAGVICFSPDSQGAQHKKI